MFSDRVPVEFQVVREGSSSSCCLMIVCYGSQVPLTAILRTGQTVKVVMRVAM